MNSAEEMRELAESVNKENSITDAECFENTILEAVKNAASRGEFNVSVYCGPDGELATKIRMSLTKKGFNVSVALGKDMCYKIKIYWNK